MSYVLSNVEKCVKNKFHINHDLNPSTDIKCVVSQYSDELNQYLKEEGFDYTVSEFNPDGKWSCLHMHKIKAKWLKPCKQKLINNQVYNIVPVKRISDNTYKISCIDYDMILKNNTVVTGETILLPCKEYFIVNKINERMEDLQICDMAVKQNDIYDIYHIAVTRQGLYVNKKFRSKKEIITDDINRDIVTSYEFTLIDKNTKTQVIVKIS